MPLFSLYPMKYLIDVFFPYGSSLEANVLLTSMSYILSAFFCKIYIFDIFVSKIFALPTHFYNSWKKSKFFFITILVV